MLLSLSASVQTAAHPTYSIAYAEDNPIVFSKEYESFKNVTTSKFSYDDQTFISQDGKEWIFKLSNKKGVKRVSGYLQIESSATLNSPDMSKFENGYKVVLNFYRSGTATTSLCYLGNDENPVKSAGTSNGTTYNKLNGYTAEIEVPSGVQFYIENGGNVATIESITITPNPTIAKQATQLSFPAASYTVKEGEENDFTSPTATLTTTDGESISNATIAYAISQNDYLSIDQLSGKISGEFKAGQTVTITATFAGDETYEPTSASYQLQVVAAEETVLTLDETQDIEIAKYDGTTVQVILKRKLTGRYNTLCLPFDLTAEQLHEAFGEDCVLSEYSNVENGVMYFNAVNDLKAGTPYLLSISGTLEEITIPNVLISNTQPEQVSRSDNAAFMYCGAYSPFTFTAADGSQLFLTASGVLKKPSSVGMKMKGMRAYFLVPTTVDVNTMSVNVDNGLSAIHDLPCDNSRTFLGVYSLSGQRLCDDTRSLQPGIYIVNGQKRAVK